MRDLTGEKFGEILVLEKSFIKRRIQYYLCQCKCGFQWSVSAYRLVCKDERKSAKNCYACGRLNASKKVIKHGATKGKNRLYNIWAGMKRRCNDNRERSKRRYKDRGIFVCDEWANLNDGFVNFSTWANNNGYSEKLTLDRIDNDGPYAPWNCRWVTQKEQLMNREITIILELDGQKMTIREAVSYYNNIVSYEVARRRIREGWEPLKALTTPKITRKGPSPKSDPSEWIKWAPEVFSITLLAEFIED